MLTPFIPQPKPPFPYDRPLSYSQLSSFKWNKRQWYDRYVLGIKSDSSPEMDFGKKVGERLASDPSYLPQVPRLPIFEYELKTTFMDIPLIGYIDSLDIKKKKLYEFKTGRNKWDAKRVKNHSQIDMYLLILYLTLKIKPDDFECELHWMPTHINDKQIEFIEPFKVHSFKANRKLVDVLTFANSILETRQQMLDYYNSV